MPQPPSGTVTFLFTDVERSTQLWESVPDAMRAALERHDALLRAAIDAGGGYLVKSTGDGVHAAFDRADDAMSAAVAMQQTLAREPWPEGAEVRVRIGMHTGDASARDGDYFGPAVNRAARLMAIAHGGQIVVSAATARLLADALPAGTTLVDLGEHRLRDLSQPERVYQVSAPGLPSEFGALRSLENYRTNLPLRLTSLVGREQVLAEISSVLETEKMVTITGVGGVGKTRLALQVAADRVPEYADGVWLFEFAAATDRDDVLQIVASVLDVPVRPGLSLEASVLETIRGKQLLLVFDNCEHLLEPTATLAEQVLRACPDVRILATSREGLGVAGEQVWPLRSLSVPDRGAAPDELEGVAAVQLFVERARAALPTFRLDESSASSVAEICRRLDGIPLAIELAAARVTAMTTREISTLLDERFRLLTGGRRSAAERHQTLRAAVDWSYSLLAPVEQRVFDSLAVFAGTFDLDAATAVIAGDGIEAWDVLDALASLVAKSMLSAEGDTTTRYRQLETLRQYAFERLHEAGSVDSDRRRHAEHYALFAEAAAVGLLGTDELAWAVRVAEEIDNLRAALTWALDGPNAADHVLGLRIVAACAIDANSGRIGGVGAWAERVLPLIGESSVADRAAIQAAAAWQALHRGDIDTARALATEATGPDLSTEVPALPLAYMVLGMTYLVAGDFDRAVDSARFGRARLAADNAWGTVVLSLAVASFALLAGQSDDGASEADACARLARSLGNPSLIVGAQLVAVVVTWRDDPVGAASALDECIELTHAGAAGFVFGQTLAIRALLFALEGDAPAALGHLREAIRFSHDKGDLPMLSVVFEYGLEILEALGYDAPAGFFAGCASSPLMTMVANMPPQEVPNRDRAIEALRGWLGPSTYDEAVARAAALPIDDAVKGAVAQLDELLGGLAPEPSRPARGI